MCVAELQLRAMGSLRESLNQNSAWWQSRQVLRSVVTYQMSGQAPHDLFAVLGSISRQDFRTNALTDSPEQQC